MPRAQKSNAQKSNAPKSLRSLVSAIAHRSPVRASTHAPPPQPAPAPVVGVVEEFSPQLIRGWIVVGREAEPVRVDLYVGDLLLAATYATPDSAMSGVDSVLRAGDSAIDGQTPGPVAVPLVHSWQRQPVPGPADDRRNALRQVRTFSFRVRGIWRYLSPRTKVSVQVRGQWLPISGHGTYLSPPRSGRHSMAELRELLDSGHVLTQQGDVRLSKTLDRPWQARVMGLYGRLRTAFAEEFGYDLFLTYGTLLGAVRDGGVIGHDVDFDSGYVSRETSGPAAARELVEIARRLIELGFEVECRLTCLHVKDPRDPEDKVDVFHTYFGADRTLQLPFGYAGTSQVGQDEWAGTTEIDFAGARGLVPVAAESLVACLYGADWRQPKPGFNWRLARSGSAPEGRIPVAGQTKVYWANFYADHAYVDGSSFFEFIDARPDTPDTIVDLGCGDGRDSWAFAGSGRSVLGLDQSPVGIDHAAARGGAGPEPTVLFKECDVADITSLGAALDDLLLASEGPVLYYLRFFLHAINEETQRRLLDAIDAHARPGDSFAAEFRTDADLAQPKVHGDHYRRYQSAAALIGDLEARGWEVIHQEEGAGLSPYGDEDPVLCRVVARRPEADLGPAAS